jgi:F-type H+-transporting ATPase subunit gamma
LVDEFIDGAIDRAVVAYTDYRSVGSQVATWTQILPIAKGEVRGEEGAIAPLYEFEPEPARILSLLLPRYVNTVVHAALLESAASEHAMRRRAMKAATDNAQDLIKVLTRVINRERQAEITGEILEVVSGAEALRKVEKAGAR